MGVEELDELALVVEARRARTGRTDAVSAPVTPRPEDQATAGNAKRAVASDRSQGTGTVQPAAPAVERHRSRFELGGVAVGTDVRHRPVASREAIVSIEARRCNLLHVTVARVLSHRLGEESRVLARGPHPGHEQTWKQTDENRELVAVEALVGALPGVEEPGEGYAAGKGHVRVGVEDGVARSRGPDGGVTACHQSLGRPPVVGDALGPHPSVRPGLRHDPVDDLRRVPHLRQGPGVAARSKGGPRPADVGAHDGVAAAHEVLGGVGGFGKFREGPAEHHRAPVAALAEKGGKPLALPEPGGQEDVDGDSGAVAHLEIPGAPLDSGVARRARLVASPLGGRCVARLGIGLPAGKAQQRRRREQRNQAIEPSPPGMDNQTHYVY
jgi:hypothetical protein